MRPCESSMRLLAVAFGLTRQSRFLANAFVPSSITSKTTNCCSSDGDFLLRFPVRNKPSSVPYSSTSGSNVDMSAAIQSSLQTVRDKITAASELKGGIDVRLVAVSKTKPITLLQEAYDAGQRIFGENYAQELAEKIPQLDSYATDTLPTYHFIGALQSNKVNLLVNAIAPDVHRLVIETVASTKLANKLQNAAERFVIESDEHRRIGVFVQVNTSGEESKSGITELKEIQELCQHITTQCDRLELRGLMTIGAVGDLSCFSRLVELQQQVDPSLELSMGMSGDFEAAIAAGSTNVRVGSTIFGVRDYSNNA